MKRTKGSKMACVALLAWLGVGHVAARKVALTVSNNGDLQRQEVVGFDLKELLQRMQEAEGQTFVIRNIKGQEVDYQITHDGKVLVDASVSPHSTLNLTAEKGTPRQPKVYVCGKQYPIRKDDIAWENDRGAYRIYGPALQRTGEKSYGTDIWVKNTPDLVVEERYLNDLYGNVLGDALDKAHRKAEADSVDLATTFHLDHGNGMDGYAVGPTLGCGAPALIVGGKLVLPYCYQSFRILDNGPLRFTVELTYAPNSLGITEHRRISLDKGSHFNRWTVWYDGVGDDVEFCSGVVVNGNGKPDLKKNHVTYADPTDNPRLHNSQIYVAAVFPYNKVETKLSPDKRNAVGVVKNYHGEPVTYYAGSAWSGYDVRTYPQWQLLVEEFVAGKAQPLQVKME